MSARDFSTISPSARQILLVRAHTDLAYAREAAVRMVGEDAVAAIGRDLAANPDARKRVIHFERRARSIDAAIAKRASTLVLELAAGFTFRGVELCKRPGICYVDTDLDAVVATKRALLDELGIGALAGDYRLTPLEATDPAAFVALVDTLPAGPLTVVNEGLLVYLDRSEKAGLCATVHDVLKRRGGAWVTADVYIRTETTMYREPATRAFLEQHNVDNNKFGSYDEAAQFFAGCGFAIEARVPSSLDGNHPRETWTLVPA